MTVEQDMTLERIGARYLRPMIAEAISAGIPLTTLITMIIEQATVTD